MIVIAAKLKCRRLPLGDVPEAQQRKKEEKRVAASILDARVPQRHHSEYVRMHDRC